MKNYRKINKGSAHDGDIVRVIESVFDDSIGSDIWANNFVNRVRYFRITMVKNNGTCHGYDSNGNFRLFHLLDRKIEGVYRKESV